ncbi:serine hydrolase domain-containing protein [Acuticoccus kandeliae]|uniref:serine hydrolase domain-containing protein n=1 Tax=Acuticoccus kandeliae TaxID=2073160 RepID=UPI00130025AC|nr:serine hydrolase domain-containing protein [Acuticoccus kandeliae]
MACVSTPSDAQALSSDLEAAIAKRVDSLGKDAPPGFAFSIVRRGDGEIFARRTGLEDIEQSRPVVDETIFPFASITKTFTAIAIMLLEEEGKLSLDDPLSKTMPDFPNAAAITLRDLLVHTSGIADFTQIPAFDNDQYRDWTPDELIALIEKAPPVFAPGAKCVYNDSGYILLGRVIEIVSGEAFMSFVDDRISTPLQMDSVAPGDVHALVEHRAAGYVKSDTGELNEPQYSLSAPWAAGGLVGEIGDLMKLPLVLWDGGPLISDASRKAMLAPAMLADGSACSYPLPGGSGSYGLGLEFVNIAPLGDHRAVGKSGVFPGYSGYYAVIEGTDYAIGVLANEDGSLNLMVEMVLDIAALLIDGPAAAPEKAAPQ